MNRTEPLLLLYAHERPADELDELYRTFAQAIGDEVELFLQRPGAAGDYQRTRWDTREHALERLDQEVHVERLLLPAGLEGPRRRRKRERLLLRALEQLARDLLVGAVLLE